MFVAQETTVLSSSQNKTLGVTEISSIPMGEIGNQKSLHQTAKLIKLVCLERYGKETFAAAPGNQVAILLHPEMRGTFAGFATLITGPKGASLPFLQRGFPPFKGELELFPGGLHQAHAHR